MITLGDLDRELSALIENLWPGQSITADFAPLVDLSLGDAGSDVAIRLADRMTLHPEKVTAAITSRWPPNAAYSLEALRGYLNIRFRDEEALAIEPRTAALKQKHILIAVPFVGERQRPLAMMRLAFAAALQYGLAKSHGYEASVVYGGNLQKRFAGSPINLARELLAEICSEPRGLELAHLLDAARTLGSGAVTLWLLPQTLSRGEFSQLCTAFSDTESELHIQSPPAPWLDFRTHTEKVSEFLRWSDGELSMLLWYLSQACPALDLDFFVARSAEEANLYWFWQSVVERGKRVLESIKMTEIRNATLNSLSSSIRAIALRRRYLGVFQERAARIGRVADFATVLHDLLSQVSRVLNNPDFRIFLTNASPGGIDQQILAGAVQILSASITTCDFGRGKCYGSDAGTAYKTNC